jgi:fructuronate reductase
MRYVGGVDEKGQPIEIRDPMQKQLAECVAASDDGEARVRALLSLREVFGEDLLQNGDVVARLTAWYQQLTTQGARATVHQCLNHG